MIHECCSPSTRTLITWNTTAYSVMSATSVSTYFIRARRLPRASRLPIKYANWLLENFMREGPASGAALIPYGGRDYGEDANERGSLGSASHPLVY